MQHEGVIALIAGLFNSTLETISDIASEHGIAGAAGIAALTLGYRYFSAKIRLQSLIQPTGPDIRLDQHPLFETIDHWLDYGIKQIRFPRRKYPIRARLYRDLLAALVLAIRKAACTHIDALANAKTPYEWREAARGLLTGIVDTYEADLRRQGCPEIVIAKFAEWHRGSLAYIEHNITSLGDTTIADSHQKTHALLSAVLSSTKTAVYDAERTLITLNGELSGQKYQGETIE